MVHHRSSDNVEPMAILKGLLINAGADLNTEVIMGKRTQGRVIGAGRQYEITKSPSDIIATHCSSQDVGFLSEQYALGSSSAAVAWYRLGVDFGCARYALSPIFFKKKMEMEKKKMT